MSEAAVTRHPATGRPRATLLIAGAMGVPRRFYAPLASHFAENGIHVETFDYPFEGDLSTWVEALDRRLAATRDWAPDLPLLYLGHSLGGQLLGVLPHAADVNAALTVTAGSGYYRFNDRMPLQVRIFWFVAIPLLTPLFGYFPGKRLRMVGDLPKGVAWQWRRWCLHPEYLLAEGEAYRAAFDRVRIPIRGYSFEDDSIVTKPAIDHLHAFYRAASVERRHVAPADVGARRLGHFGYFSEASRDTLWRESLEWLGTAVA
jgi:predicted alpha/beta hydrolase